MDTEEQNQKTRMFLREQALQSILNQAPMNIQKTLEEAEAIKRWATEILDEGIKTGHKQKELER